MTVRQPQNSRTPSVGRKKERKRQIKRKKEKGREEKRKKKRKERWTDGAVGEGEREERKEECLAPFHPGLLGSIRRNC